MGAFRDFFTGLWKDYIKSPLEDVKGHLDTKVGAPIKDAIGNVFDVLERIKTEVGEIPTKISETVTKLGEVKDTLDGVYAWFVEQKEGVVGFFGDVLEYKRNREISFWIGWMQRVKCVTAADNVYKWMPKHVRENPGVSGYYKFRKEELTEEGSVGLKDVAGSMFRPLAGELYNGMKDLADDMSDAAGGAVAKLYKKLFSSWTGQKLSSKAEKKLSGTNVPEAIEGVLDSIIETAMLPFDKGAEASGKKIPAEAKAAIKEILKLGAGLGGVVGLQGYIMEHFHPTKHTGAARALNMVLEMVGFRQLRDAYIQPLRYQLIRLPLEYKWNSLIQAKIPNEGEITGLARKYEITKDQYRKAMKQQGIGEFWIDKLLQGFWADPRLFEIIRLMEVERPPTEVNPDAAVWLKKAGLEKYIGDDWWLAMKFGKAGYDEIDIPVLISAVKARNMQRELGDIRMFNRNLYQNGVYTREEFEAILAKRGVSVPEGKEVMDAIDMTVKRTNEREIQRAYERKYQFGHLTKEELEKKLGTLGLHADYIKGRVEYLFTMKAGKLLGEGDEKDLSDVKIINAYKWGQKEKGWAVKMLDDKGWSTEDAILLAESVDVKIENDTIKEWMRAYETRTMNGRMSIEELKKMYVELGKTEDWAEARAAYMEERVLGKEEVAE